MTVALWIASIVAGYVMIAVIVETAAQLTGLCREIDTPDGVFGATWPMSVPCLAVFVAGFVVAKTVWWVMTRTKTTVARLSSVISTFTKRSKLPPARVVK